MSIQSLTVAMSHMVIFEGDSMLPTTLFLMIVKNRFALASETIGQFHEAHFIALYPFNGGEKDGMSCSNVFSTTSDDL